MKRFSTFNKVAFATVSIALLVFVWGRINALSRNVEVSRDEMIIATVEKGDLIREVRAPGTLVPIALNFLAATSNGRVKNILLEASDAVDVGTVIMELENPELSQAVDEAKLEVEVLQSAYHSLQQRWQQALLKQRIVVADFSARFEITKLRREANQRLLATGAVSSIDYNESILREQQLKFQHQLEIELLESLPQLSQAELVAAQAKTNKATRQLLLQQKLASDLYVKATTKGILQEVTLQVGEPFKVGTVLAQIAEQDNLKAELRVQESQVKDVIKGQSVVISAGGKKAHGVVKRINPSVKQGVVMVDVYFTDDALIGARPDLRIDGVIELEHLKNVLKIKRPVFTQEYSSGSLFVLNKTKTVAERKQVRFGRSSVDVIEVLEHLNIGDRVIVSSTNKYDELTKISLY
ncbi:efflux RND transporter periplasmic adaptor subunit [Thalassotalea sp. ND16A]|uniref:efflux RND transporter periplasmic adaptor subunit n=1 Tax=Thalassotalea sp. ND16A TaxID=1535422 RepID=UPI000519EE2B|nr:HlyD family efflux transporter periplasmic adaptor subunit [Thalassotalea sp. ND16A]